MRTKPIPMNFRTLGSTMKTVCEICGKRKCGTGHPDHTECSKIRKARGF